MSNIISGSQVAAKGQEVEVMVDEEVKANIARMLAITITQGNPTLISLMSVDDIASCFSYALNVVLAVDSGAKPVHDAVPIFFTDLFMPINAKYRGVRITVNPLTMPERPSLYAEFVSLMASVGVPMGRPQRIDPYGESKVMQLGLKMVDGEIYICGVDSQVTIEELVVRAMLTVSKQEQDKLDRILGHLDQLYASRDELVRQWACSIPRDKVTLAR
jgi:hypothetical protein